jgi:hypothetical protein
MCGTCFRIYDARRGVKQEVDAGDAMINNIEDFDALRQFLDKCCCVEYKFIGRYKPYSALKKHFLPRRLSMKPLCTPLAILLLSLLATQAISREWTDSTGKYSTEAALLAFNDKLAVLEKQNHQLVAVRIEKLSKQDQDYLKSKDAAATLQEAGGRYNTWTMKSGLKVIGRVVDYGRKNVTIQRRRGKIYVNDRLFDNLPEVCRRMLPGIVAHFEKIDVPDQKAFEAWVVKQMGEPRTFTCDGVSIELENGDEYGVPFFLFSQDDLAILEPGWKRWLAADQDREKKQHEAFLVEAQAQAYKQDQKNTQQIALMQLQMQAYDAGLFDLWEVQLLPGPSMNRSPMVVVMPARDSRSAAMEAVQRNPGYTAGAVVRLGRR